jgi:hypothetical protein
MRLLLIAVRLHCHSHERADKMPNGNHDLRALYAGMGFA